MRSPSPWNATVSRPCRLLASAAPSFVPGPGPARAAVPAVGLVEIPQLVRPGVADRVTDKRPVLVPDLGIDLRAHARGRDRTRVPADSGVRLRALHHGEPRRAELLAARLVGRLAAGVDQPLDRLDERRQRGFAVAGNREIDLLVAPKIL